MRQGGLDLDRRGPEFEKFCREDIALCLMNFPIKQSVVLLCQSFRFKPPMEREEEIDIVIVVADTVLIVEVKCILWPDSSLQFANYRDPVEKAAAQIIGKRDAIQRNYVSFSENSGNLATARPAKCSLVC